MAPEAMQKTSRRPRSFFNSDFIKIDFFYGGEAGIRTLGTLLFTCSPNMRLRPLGHLSVKLNELTLKTCRSILVCII